MKWRDSFLIIPFIGLVSILCFGAVIAIPNKSSNAGKNSRCEHCEQFVKVWTNKPVSEVLLKYGTPSSTSPEKDNGVSGTYDGSIRLYELKFDKHKCAFLIRYKDKRVQYPILTDHDHKIRWM